MDGPRDVNLGIAWINDVVSNRQRRLVYTTSFIVAFAGAIYDWRELSRLPSHFTDVELATSRKHVGVS